MITKQAHLIYFSPTHTSKQVAEAIVRGTGITNVVTTNLTLQPAQELVLDESALAVISVPVYGGHVAPLALDRLNSLRGNNTPVVLVVVYGNRAYEKSLMELDFWAVEHGFKVIAGGTFIGEHSFSSEKYPVSAGRPNQDDLNKAMDFGRKIAAKVEAAADTDKLYAIDVRSIRRPRQPFFPLFRFLRKVIALRKSGTPIPRTPWIPDESMCVHCGVCAENCPSGAIIRGDELKVDADKCIKCCTCVKNCSQEARVYDTPFVVLLSQCFERQKEPQTLL